MAYPTEPVRSNEDARASGGLDAQLNDASRQGLTATAGSEAYEEARDPDDISRAPDPRDELDPPKWRNDFPIDVPKDEFVARRDFAKFLVLTGSAFVAGQGWIAAQDIVRSRRSRPARLRIASKQELPAGGVKIFSYPNAHDSCVLVHLPDGELVAFSQLCTHLSCAVVPKVAEGVFHCPCHAGYFDLRTGKNIAGPPPRPLARIVLETDGDHIYAVGVEARTVV
jgi:nitrite reductase/ring-hydroxylating ferredoxin subunit